MVHLPEKVLADGAEGGIAEELGDELVTVELLDHLELLDGAPAADGVSPIGALSLPRRFIALVVTAVRWTRCAQKTNT